MNKSILMKNKRVGSHYIYKKRKHKKTNIGNRIKTIVEIRQDSDNYKQFFSTMLFRLYQNI